LAPATLWQGRKSIDSASIGYHPFDEVQQVNMSASSQQPWCKICGITNPEDVSAVVVAGGDALGFNFYPNSARYLATEVAAELCREVKNAAPTVERIGLFVDATEDQVRQITGAVDLTMLQFHGDETPEYCEQFGLPYIKVIGVNGDTDFETFEDRFAGAWALLLDTHDPLLKGGTGRRFDWNLWPRSSTSRLILAGGLDSKNVADAVHLIQPFGVDVAGGVESGTKGVKDHGKVRTFIEAAKHG
jgi:phosphoribosylanthranilate isomerase